MKRTLLAVLGMLVSSGCGGSPPPVGPAPPAPPVGGGTLVLSGFVFGIDAAGRRPLIGATVDMSEPEAPWGTFGRPVTNGSGRYTFGSLPPRHYQVRATMPGYEPSPIVMVGYLETSKTQDIELVQTGSSTGPMTVTSIEPGAGSSDGGTTVRILGTGFRSGTTVTFDAERTPGYVLNTTTMHALTPAHAAGTVNVTVTSATGEVATLNAAFRYALPQSFDFNGTWIGSALAHPVTQMAVIRIHPHSDMEMGFTIENNLLTSFTCGGSSIALVAPLPTVTNGAFSFADGNGTLDGRIVSDGAATGAINTMACPGTRWYASRP